MNAEGNPRSNCRPRFQYNSIVCAIGTLSAELAAGYACCVVGCFWECQQPPGGWAGSNSDDTNQFGSKGAQGCTKGLLQQLGGHPNLSRP